MKAFIATIGICALLLAPVAATATVQTFTWTGTVNGNWHISGNWTQTPGSGSFPGGPSGWPPVERTTDVVAIDHDAANQPQFTSSSGDGTNNDREIALLTLDAETDDDTVTFDITGDELIVSGDTTLVAAIDAANNATMTINGSGATFEPQGDILLYGGDPNGTRGQAKFSLESTGSLSAPVDLVMQGDSRFETRQTHSISTTDLKIEPDTVDNYMTEAVVQVVTSGHNFTVDDITIGGLDEYASRLEKTGSGEITGSTMTLTAPTDVAADVKFLLSAGIADIDGIVQLNSDSTNAAQAIIEVSNDATFEPNSIDCNGGDTVGEEAELIFNEDVTVQTGGTSFYGLCKVTLGANTNFYAKAVTLEDAAVDLMVTGTNATSSVFRLDSWTNTLDGDATFNGPLVVARY